MNAKMIQKFRRVIEIASKAIESPPYHSEMLRDIDRDNIAVCLDWINEHEEINKKRTKAIFLGKPKETK